MTGRHDTIGARSGEPLRQRHPGAGRPAAVLPGLPGDRAAVAGCCRAGGRRDVAHACRENGCALIGGETAEMPGFYADGEYDVAGFIVGVVERSRLVDGRRIAPGDVLIGLPSSGLHTNGYSLARRVFFEVCGWTPDTVLPELGQSLGDALLATHRSYLRAIRPLHRGGAGQGHGAHHRRRHHREPAARAAGGMRRADRSRVLGSASRSSIFCARAAESPTTRCSARSTWASG